MTTSRLQQIENILRSRGIGEAHNRLALASKLAQHKRPFTSETVDRLAAHFTGLGKDPVSHIMLEIQSGDWAETDESLLDEQRKVRSDGESEKRGSASMASVTEQNPYGWTQRTAIQEYSDHDEPGKWNAYRQSYNLTATEREASGARDHRMRGCSRPEVVTGSKVSGWRPGTGEPTTDGNAPRIEFDRLEVERAKGNDFGDPGASQGPSKPSQERKVYGE